MTAPAPAGGTWLLRAGRPLFALVVVAVVLALPWMGMNAYRMRQVILIAILSLIVSGLNTSLGYGGELAVGQVALYAVGAYAASWLAVRHGVDDILLCTLLAIAAVIVVGFVSGIPGLRLGGWSLAMMTFFLVLLIPNFVNLLHGITGGSDGLTGIPFPRILGVHLQTPGHGKTFYLYVIVVTAVWFALLRNLIKSPHGDAFLVLKQSPILASTLGISVYRLKLFAYVVGAIPCGIAGVLFAFLSSYISPSSFTFTMALAILTASIVGGSQSLYGAFFGAALLQLGPEQIGSSFQKYALIVYGAFLLAAGLIFSDGFAGIARSLGRRVTRFGWFPKVATVRAEAPGTPEPADPSDAVGTLAGETLSVEAATKLFGGVGALDDVTLEARPGQITALIGPNGSGKTTLLNLVSGFYKPTSGSVRLGDTRVSGLAPYRTARKGVARTFQTPLIPKSMTTRAFVATGRYVTHRIRIPAAALRLPSFRRGMAANDAEAMRLLRLLGVANVADQQVTSLALGTRRLVEVARTLASEPKVFLFDEVGSGLDEEDLHKLEQAMDLIRTAGGTVVLVEHNFPLVLKVADRIHVLSNGRLVASGTPAEIQANPRVLEEYAGPAMRGETLAQLDEGGGGPGTLAKEIH
ncbi:MAG TPA: branched-chain amino acid ABC transporter ATP-binding protein/permease [Acidimicrobiales bacterium]|nr:branched-chain amino acid ABC transporter ATP-binding protein/permease [Acidimicrobiales bacterium]